MAAALIALLLFTGCGSASADTEIDSANSAVLSETSAEISADTSQPETETLSGVSEDAAVLEADNDANTDTGTSYTEESGTGSTAINLADIPAYSGSPYVEINGNVPNFAESDFTETSFESYGSLDSLGRCTTAYANIGTDLMPTEERGSIGQVKPSGWHTVKYNGIVDGNYLYNRCHLIGYQLTAENANEQNLITGTRYLNVEGMLPFENMVADYIKETNNHVLYRVTPIFEGNNLVASGVQMEAESVEDRGASISFNVYCYNVQPQITIDYATGESYLTDGAMSANDTASSLETSAQNNEAAAQVQTDGTGGTDQTSASYILNSNTMKFHKPSCSSIKQMSDANKTEYTGNREDLISQGYEPCKRCNP